MVLIVAKKESKSGEFYKCVDEEVKGIIGDMKSERMKVTYKNTNITFLFGTYKCTYKTDLLNEDYTKEMNEEENNIEELKVARKKQRNISNHV